MSEEPGYLKIGRIVGAFGLKGELKIELLTGFTERFNQGSRLRMAGRWVDVEGARWNKERLLLKLTGIDTIDQAEKLQWQYLEGRSDERPALEEDEFLTDDLIGMSVVTDDGRQLGKVDEVLSLPAQDVLRIGEVMIPVVKEFVQSIDLETKTITVHLIPGMLPGEDA